MSPDEYIKESETVLVATNADLTLSTNRGVVAVFFVPKAAVST